jgi:carbonic anhydrase
MSNAFGMSRRSFLAGLVACPVCAAGANIPEWDYDNSGPRKWAALDPGFSICGTGEQQSPVNLHDGLKAQLPKLQLHWKNEKFTIWNNRHTIQLNVRAGNFAEVGPEKFDLIQFHFHTPSEHAIDGKRTAVEAHFVHSQKSGRLAVLGVLLVPGGHNAAFSAIMNTAPNRPDAKLVSPFPISPSELLPGSLQSTWRYEGSLTTPPCSQIVDWIIFDQAVSVAQPDIELFQRIFPANARPLQPLNRRYLLRS